MGNTLSALLLYLLGGVTFLPLLATAILLHAWLTFPVIVDEEPAVQLDHGSPEDEAERLKQADWLVDHDVDASGYFAVCREFVPAGINGKPPERTSPSGAVVTPETPSVYQSMYRGIFQKKTTTSAETSSPGKRRARNVFYVVLRHGHLMLYDDEDQLEVRHVISLAYHDVTISAGGEDIPEGELWIRRNAICLQRRRHSVDTSGDSTLSRPFYFFSENCSEKEDFYYALIQSQGQDRNDPATHPHPLNFEIPDVIKLVQRLHSSEENLQTRWLNAIIGRVFLALYKEPKIEAFIRAKITKKIARVSKPAFITDLAVHRISLGEGAPSILNPRLKDLNVDGDCVIEADVSYAGNLRVEVAAKARIELGSHFKAREVDLVLAVNVKKLDGRALVRLKPPPSNRLWISFEKMPKIEMTIEPIVSSRQITYNIILRAIESRILEVMAETIVLPHWDDMPFFDTDNYVFRGGMWLDNKTTTSQQEKTTKELSAEEGLVEEIRKEESEAKEPESPEANGLTEKDERSHSMPALSDTLPSTLISRKPGASALGKDVKDAGISTSSDTASSPSHRVNRSPSYSSPASPVVGIEAATADRSSTKSSERSDAASAMMAIARKSQPPTPAESPAGSPSKGSVISERLGQKAEEAASINSDEGQTGEIPSDTVSLAHSKGSINSIKRLSKHNTPPHESLLSNALSALTAKNSSAEHANTNTSVTAIANATMVAKKWGFNMLNRKSTTKSDTSTEDPPGSPKHPMGRGQPLPPPGVPLPGPNKPRSFSFLGRRSSPPASGRKTPEKKKEGSATNTDPASPSSKADEEVLVVAAPAESQPTTPRSEETSFELNKTQDAIDTPHSSSHMSEPAFEEEDAIPSSYSSERRRRAASLLVDDNERIESWHAAQEEEERIRNAWIDPEPGHS